MKFNEIRKNYLETLVHVRGINSTTAAEHEVNSMLEKENEFCDLLLSIENGNKDV
jgi:hypothetical protein